MFPSGHQINRCGAESEEREVDYICHMRNESRNWSLSAGEEKTLGMWQLSSNIRRAVMTKKD